MKGLKKELVPLTGLNLRLIKNAINYILIKKKKKTS